MTKIRSIFAAFAIALILLPGCATFKDPHSVTIRAIRSATATGTVLALAEHPEWREQFTAARDQLNALLKAGSLDFAQIQSIVAQLPVKELQGAEARIIISNAELILDDYVKEYTTLDKVAAVSVVAQAILDGLNKAL